MLNEQQKRDLRGYIKLLKLIYKDQIKQTEYEKNLSDNYYF